MGEGDGHILSENAERSFTAQVQVPRSEFEGYEGGRDSSDLLRQRRLSRSLKMLQRSIMVMAALGACF